jgi:inosine-uridine nucleoside N-ribohydrolase
MIVQKIQRKKMSMIPIILDTDIGTNVYDALALRLAVHSPEIDILVVTSVGVDVHLRLSSGVTGACLD